MQSLRWLALPALLFFAQDLRSQEVLSGKIFDLKTDSTIANVVIVNRSRSLNTTTSYSGQYSIRAAEGDTLEFSTLGYFGDTIIVQYHMLISGLDRSLRPKPDFLPTVRVSGYSSYQADSTERSEWYRQFREKKLNPLVGGQTPSYGFGLVLSPFSWLSGKQQQTRQLKKDLPVQEEQAYIDFRFNKQQVARLTGLTGDSLQSFMVRYRPTYEFCRKSSESDMLDYINNCLKAYLGKEKL